MNLNSVLIGSDQPEALAAYYEKVFGPPALEFDAFRTWRIGTGMLTVGPHDQVTGRSAHPGRVIWNIETADVPGEFERLRDAGAIVVREPYGPGQEGEGWIATFADPDDNYFQLVSPM